MLLKNDHFFVFVKYLSVHCQCEPFWKFITKWNYMAKNLNSCKRYFFLLFPKLTFILLYVSKYKSILLRVYSNLLFYKDFSGNTISEIKICLNIDDVFKLFEIVLANFHDKFHKKLKRRCYIFIFFCLFVFVVFFVFLKKRTMVQCLYWPLVSYISIFWDSCKAN